MKTFMASPATIDRKWYVVDAEGIGRVAQIGSLLRVTDDGGIERTLIAGRVLYHESLREAVAS